VRSLDDLDGLRQLQSDIESSMNKNGEATNLPQLAKRKGRRR